MEDPRLDWMDSGWMRVQLVFGLLREVGREWAVCISGRYRFRVIIKEWALALGGQRLSSATSGCEYESASIKYTFSHILITQNVGPTTVPGSM